MDEQATTAREKSIVGERRLWRAVRRGLAFTALVIAACEVRSGGDELSSNSTALQSVDPRGPDFVDPGFGTWALSGLPGPIQVIHASLLRNNKILAIGGSQYDCCYYWGRVAAYLYDIPTGTWSSIGGPYDALSDAFCSGHAHDHLGR